MNKLYITDDTDFVRKTAKTFAKTNGLEFYDVPSGKDGLKTVIEIYSDSDNGVIFLEKINKLNINNILLKLLEDNKKNLHLFTCSPLNDVSDAVKSRFKIVRLTAENKTDVFSKYETLANRLVNNRQYTKLHNLNSLLHTLQLTSTNTPQQIIDYKLKKEGLF